MLQPLPPSLVKHVVYPVYRGLRGDRILEILAELERNQWLSPEELEDLQWRRLKHLLAQATTHVPYYRDLFALHELAVKDIQSPADFRRVPFLTKDIIRAQQSRFITRDPFRKGYASSTGGSTGEPLYFHVDWVAGPIRRANGLRGNRWAGVDIGDRQAVLWGIHLDVSLREHLVTGVRNYFNNIMYLSSFDMTEQSMNMYAVRLRRFRPHLIVAYPSALTLLADFYRGTNLRPVQPRAVITSGEQLYQAQREVIESVFECPVFNRYGSRELDGTAQECDEHSGLHVFVDMQYVEVIHESGRPARDGEVGEVVVTDFYNLYMPFIRYRTGDLAVPSDRLCPCGRGLPLLGRVEGRAFDVIVTPDGKTVGGFFWTWLSRSVPGIIRFQIEQRDRSGITFWIVPGPDWRDEFTQQLERSIQENCGTDFRVQFKIVEEIVLTPAGKSKFIVSRIDEREIIKSKIHKAHVTGDEPDHMDCLVIDEELMERGDIAEYEKVLVVDNTNGVRLETFAVKGERGNGAILTGGAVSKLIRVGDEISIMAFAWSDGSEETFSNLLVDENNRFIRYMKDIAGGNL